MKNKVLITGAAGFIGYHVAKKLVMEGTINTELPEINSVHQVQIFYSQVAYSLLSSIIVNTSESESDFAECLFSSGKESMWPLLVDCKEDFSFEV